MINEKNFQSENLPDNCNKHIPDLILWENGWWGKIGKEVFIHRKYYKPENLIIFISQALFNENMTNVLEDPFHVV